MSLGHFAAVLLLFSSIFEAKEVDGPRLHAAWALTLHVSYCSLGPNRSEILLPERDKPPKLAKAVAGL